MSQVGDDSSGPGPGLPASVDDDAATRVFSHHGQVTWPQCLTVNVAPTEPPAQHVPNPPASVRPRTGTLNASTAPGKIVRCPSL